MKFFHIIHIHGGIPENDTTFQKLSWYDEFIESQLKPNHITPEHQNDRYSYITDFYTKWHGRYFYLYAIYHDPSKNAISPSFDVKIARLEYIRSNSYSLAYMRHTGKWYVLFFGISIDECLEAIDNMPHFLLQ